MAFPWDKAYEQDVRTHGAPHLKTFDVTNAQELSEHVLEAMPLLEDLAIVAPKDTHDHLAALQPFLAALNQRAAFQHLRGAVPVPTGRRGVGPFALHPRGSPLRGTPDLPHVSPVGFWAAFHANFSTLLRQDCFPALQLLWLQSDTNTRRTSRTPCTSTPDPHHGPRAPMHRDRRRTR